ncbi:MULTISPECIES: SRPBCC family protein [unclassified Ensifer]|uniref:SRPBCC family protein n=1 Tax=unclassified Ensifer TaxID=2633371 RepID=UPI000813A188|nr:MULTISPECIES: SRPBCC family protein [unclassified Ensifer]OCO98211.1 polyketide cyclase [Ensifer sp. LC13]OCP05092.1 polyketide cyclase [Ensifer sp. LC14]OCP14446.1 polyketide cyclase [Ensifer sp. LC11]OCP29104.1 polyketide cyclase [Ensifer sp. LC499]
MTDRSVEHWSFTIERCFKATPEQVFTAFSEPAAKERWFVNVEAGATVTHDFRVGGRETGRFSQDDETTYYDDTIYLDIVENRRIIFAYTMTENDRKISASVATVDIQPEGNGTRLVFTEQVAFLDGLDKLEYRRGGWEQLIGVALAKELGEATVAA